MGEWVHALGLAAAVLLLLAVWPELEAWTAALVITGHRGGAGSWPVRVARRLAPQGTTGGWLRLVAVLLALAPLPVTAGVVGADLDAGLACVLTAALLGLTAAWLDDPRRTAARLPTVVLGGLTVGLAAVPIVVRVASLNVADIVIAQQGGLANWFAWRDPFLAVATGCFVAAAACLRPPARGFAAVDHDPAGPAAWTLVTSALGACLFLGGWWAFVPLLDGAGALHFAGKVLMLAVAQVWLRSRLPRPEDPTAGRPPVGLLLMVTLGAVAGSLVWIVFSGEIL